MGVTIRHLCHLLNEVEARTKLLITLSDGKPDDYDTYRGAYGIEDTRQALIEAKRDGIHSFCITIDTEAQRLPAAHVRCGELHGNRRGTQAAAEGVGYLSTSDNVTSVIAAKAGIHVCAIMLGEKSGFPLSRQ